MWIRITVILGGVFIFILLLFADKTNLSNKLEASIEGVSVTENNKGLPPLAPDEELTNLIGNLKEASESEKVNLLDSIINRLLERNRLGYAANYALEKADLLNDFNSTYEAGKLAYEATSLSFVQADTALRNSYFQRAITSLGKAVEVEPENEDANLLLGLAYVTSGDMRYSMQGIQTIRKVLEMNPDNVEASYHLGLFSIQTNQFDKAIQRFEKVLSIQPDHVMAQFQLGVALARKGENERAKEILNSLLVQEIDPELSVSVKELIRNL